VVANHPRFRFHVQGDDVDWIREIGKVRGPDGYLYEPCWIHPRDAAARDISSGDVVMVHNERGAVLVGAVVTERIVPGALGIEHGARIDPVLLEGRLVEGDDQPDAPRRRKSMPRGIMIPEMSVSAFLVQATNDGGEG
jgi:anaerobic selenocysteine-containing dehydrogenase